MRDHVLASFAFALLVAPAGCEANTDSTLPGTSEPVSTTDTSACGPGAIASVSGYRIMPMVADDQGIVLGLSSEGLTTPRTLVATLPTGASDFATVYSSDDEILRTVTADATDVFPFSDSTGTGLTLVHRIPRIGGANSLVLSSKPDQIVSPGARSGSTTYVPVDGTILAVSATGGAPKTVYTTNDTVVQVLIDGQTLFWSEGQRPAGYYTINAARAFEAPIADTLVPTELQLPAGLVGAAAVQDGVLAVAVMTSNDLQLVATSRGAAPRTLDVFPLAGVPQTDFGFLALALSGGNAYYSLDGINVREVPLDGSGPSRTLASLPQGFEWIGVGAGGRVYYASRHCVYRVPA